MSKSHRERDYILINLERFPSNIPRPCLVSEKIARFFGLTPGCTVRRPDAIDVEIAVMAELRSKLAGLAAQANQLPGEVEGGGE